MNQNTLPRKKHSAGSSQASACVQHSRDEEALLKDEAPTMSAEEFRLLKMQEAAESRREIERLRRETAERIAEERRFTFSSASKRT